MRRNKKIDLEQKENDVNLELEKIQNSKKQLKLFLNQEKNVLKTYDFLLDLWENHEDKFLDWTELLSNN